MIRKQISANIIRAHSLDALRGFAILTMVLSGVIPYGVLPNWMYHAQVPPPNHVFNPNLPGLTWVRRLRTGDFSCKIKYYPLYLEPK